MMRSDSSTRSVILNIHLNYNTSFRLSDSPSLLIFFAHDGHDTVITLCRNSPSHSTLSVHISVCCCASLLLLLLLLLLCVLFFLCENFHRIFSLEESFTRASRELHESMEKESGGNTNSHTPASLHVSGVGAVRVPQRCESGTLLSASSSRDTTVVGGVAPLGSICYERVL